MTGDSKHFCDLEKGEFFCIENPTAHFAWGVFRKIPPQRNTFSTGLIANCQRISDLPSGLDDSYNQMYWSSPQKVTPGFHIGNIFDVECKTWFPIFDVAGKLYGFPNSFNNGTPRSKVAILVNFEPTTN